jgi:hypothetical protein
MRRPHLHRTARHRRRRTLAAALGLAAVTTGVVCAQPASAADPYGRLFTVDGSMQMHDIDDGKDCVRHFGANAILEDNSEYNRDKEEAFTFRRTCGDITAEVYVIGKLRSDNVIATSGWVRVSEGKRELAWRAHAAGFSPDFTQLAGPVTFGDPSRGLVTFEWKMTNEGGWG